jgi:hopanoid-associated phosphorylase
MSARNLFVVVAVGLEFEAQLVLGEEDAKVCCGRGSEMAVALATAIGPGCGGIISFGIAGGLDPQLRTGTCIVASSVIGANGVRIALPTDERWSHYLLQSHPQAVHAPVLGIDAPVAEPVDKLRLFRQTGAAAVDMESHIAASIADSHGLPFAVLRVVADPARQRVPQAALCGMRADGSLDAFAILRALWRRPGDFAGMPSVARNAWVARAALARARHGLGRGFGLPDLG